MFSIILNNTNQIEQEKFQIMADCIDFIRIVLHNFHDVDSMVHDKITVKIRENIVEMLDKLR